MTITASARDETITLNGLGFHYRDWGDPDAPVVVLLHANTSHARSWDTIARSLADRYRVLALDQRGHGETDWATDYHEQRLVDDLTAFVDALGLDTLSLVGFSIGGSVACSYAALHPRRVDRLVMTEIFADEFSGDAAARIGSMRALPEEFSAPEAAASAYRPLAPLASEDELVRWMRDGLKRRDDGQWVWRYDPVFRVPGGSDRLNASWQTITDRLALVRCPTLFVVGSGSFHVDGAERMAAVNPRARLVRIPDTGHWMPMENPRGFLEVLRGFLAQERTSD